MHHVKTRRLPWYLRAVEVIRWLRDFEVGGGSKSESIKIPPAKLVDLLRLLLMLLQNGLPLPKALESLCADRAARRWLPVLRRLAKTVRQGGSLSVAMSHFPKTFSSVQIQQIKIGERTGSLQRAIDQMCSGLERKVATRRKIIKKLSYPLLIMCAGSGLVIFMITYVVPEFESVFSSSGVTLPMITRVVSALSRATLHYGPIALIGAGATAGFVAFMRSKPKGRLAIDRLLLRIPVFGGWIRDAGALQFADAVMSMIESGFTPVEAVEASVPCVRNRSIRLAASDVCRGVQRGERLSSEMERFPELFPATLCQLIHVGEQSGEFGQAMVGACRHLRFQLERRIDGAVSAIEPILTLSLAGVIGTVVMSIYMPMFHMFEVLE